MEKMGELGDLGWELRSLEAFLQFSWAVKQRHKGLPKGSRPWESALGTFLHYSCSHC